jgi:CRP-like cAMP-binding protein
MATDHDDDDKVRVVARSLIDNFGSRSLEVAERQVAGAYHDEHVALVWKDIVMTICNHQSGTVVALRPDRQGPQETALRMIDGNPHGMAAFLTRLKLRSELTAEAQHAILKLKSRPVRTPARQDIVMPGQTLDHACLVVSGLLGRFDQVLDGNRQITAVYVPGDMCDIHSVVAPTTAWGLTALSATETLQVPHVALKALVADYPEIGMAFWRDTTTDASILAKWISSLGRKSAIARLSHLLCEMGLRLELAGAGTRTSYAFDITQEQLGNMLGMTAVHVNRMLLSLRTDSIVTMRGHRVEINDWDRLAAVGEFDPNFLLLPQNREAA